MSEEYFVPLTVKHRSDQPEGTHIVLETPGHGSLPMVSHITFDPATHGRALLLAKRGETLEACLSHARRSGAVELHPTRISLVRTVQHLGGERTVDVDGEIVLHSPPGDAVYNLTLPLPSGDAYRESLREDPAPWYVSFRFRPDRK